MLTKLCAAISTATTGPAGPTGATGAAGADGNTLLTTSGAPSSGTGANGDYAYDPATKTIYGPKAAGTWPAGVVLAGTNGTNGTNGTTVLYNNMTPNTHSGTGTDTLHSYTLPAGTVTDAGDVIWIEGFITHSGDTVATDGKVFLEVGGVEVIDLLPPMDNPESRLYFIEGKLSRKDASNARFTGKIMRAKEEGLGSESAAGGLDNSKSHMQTRKDISFDWTSNQDIELKVTIGGSIHNPGSGAVCQSEQLFVSYMKIA
jgi:hypothetical protein